MFWLIVIIVVICLILKRVLRESAEDMAYMNSQRENNDYESTPLSDQVYERGATGNMRHGQNLPK